MAEALAALPTGHGREGGKPRPGQLRRETRVRYPIMRVLVIEQHRSRSHALKRGLEERGFAVDVAYKGEEGNDKARTTSYDLIVLNSHARGGLARWVDAVVRAEARSLAVDRPPMPPAERENLRQFLKFVQESTRGSKSENSYIQMLK